MQLEVSEVKKFWRSKLLQEKASHSVETNALREALNTLRRQMSTQTTSWTASSVRNVAYVVGVDGDGEVRLNDPEKVPGDGGSGKPVLTGSGKPVLTGSDPDFGSKLVCDAWTQLPGMAGNPSEALSSVAMAYQVFLIFDQHSFRRYLLLKVPFSNVYYLIISLSQCYIEDTDS